MLNNPSKLFADDSKVISTIKSNEDQIRLQEDIDRLVDWARKWYLNFNKEKCKVMLIGKNRLPPFKFSMAKEEGNRHYLEETKVERDLGVIISNDLKFNEQVANVVQKANGVLAMIKRTFKHWNVLNFRKLYSAFIRPHLEYCTAAWNPYKKKDIKLLEKVQRRATKLVPQLRDLNYESRLANIGIPTLEERRKRGDLIQYFKIYKKISSISLNGLSNVGNQLPHEGPVASVRRPKHQIFKQICSNGARNHFFTNRVANCWNALSEQTINSTSLNQFKKMLDKPRE